MKLFIWEKKIAHITIYTHKNDGYTFDQMLVEFIIFFSSLS